GGALQPVGCADVEHEKTVDGADQRLFIQIRGEEFGMARTHAAITGDIEVPAALGGDDADVLALGLGTLTGAAGDAELDLVRCAQALVAVLQFQRHADAVLHAVAAPGAADAGLHRTQGLAVGVPGLETGRNQLGPDIRQLVQLGAEQVDTLATGDLGVEVVLAGHLAQHNARHHRVGAVLLHVLHEGVVGVLQRYQRRVHYRLVPAGSEDGADGGLADIASDAAPAMAGQHVLEALDTLHADDAVQLLTGVGEVLAQTVIHRHTPGAQLVFEHLLEQRAATAAAGTSPGRRLEFAQIGYAGIHLAAHRPLADVV